MNVSNTVQGKTVRTCFKNLEECQFTIKEQNNKAFVFMPFNEEFDKIYAEGIKTGFKVVNWSCFRADEKFDTPEVICTICKNIQESSLIIADLTGKNPNVFLEVGLAFGLGKYVAFLSQNPDDMPFDTRTFRTIMYEPEKLEDLKEKITNLLSIKKTSKKTSGTPLPYFDILYDKKRMIDERRGISEPVSEIFIGSKYEPSEFLVTNFQKNNAMIKFGYAIYHLG